MPGEAANAPQGALPDLSVAIITRDEEANIGRCLRSVAGLAAQVVVVDSGSTDRTVELARGLGATVVHNPWPGYAAQKNVALELCSCSWVLFLDADEWLSEQLRQTLRDLLAASAPLAAGYELERRNRYLGRWIRHALGREWRLRLARREKARWSGGRIHESLTVEGPVQRLSGGLLLHEPYRDLAQHFDVTIRYARLGAEELRGRGQGRIWRGLLLSPWGRLAKSYLVRQAWRDGVRGHLLAMMDFVAVFAKYAFALEASLRGQRPDDDRG